MSSSEALAQRAPWRTWIVFGALFVLVEIAYVFIISAGTFTHWPVYSNFYDILGEGFRSGHLYLPIAPPAQLLAQPDPFDPAHSGMWLWDACLYDGKYYFYWGPLPALVQAVVKSVLGITGLIGDQYLYFALASLHYLFALLILERVSRRLFPDVPLSLFVVAALAFAFANPFPHSLASALVYQTAIVGGQTFLLLGVLLAFDAVWSTIGGERAGRKLIYAGAAWGLALACRFSLAPAVAVLVVITAVTVGQGGPHRIARFVSGALRLGLPVAEACALLLLYNKLRFDAWTDFGVHYQLSRLKYHLSVSNVPLNLYSYALRPFEWSSKFPSAIQVSSLDAHGVRKDEWLNAGSTAAEPLVGFLLAVPWSWLAPIGAIVCSERGFRRFLAPDGRGSPSRFRTIAWCAASFLVLGSITGIALLPMFVSTMRYLGDFTGGIVLLSTVCAACLWSAASIKRSLARLVLAGVIVLGIATVVLGLLFGVQGYHNHFQVNNPELYYEAVRAFDFGHG